MATYYTIYYTLTLCTLFLIPLLHSKEKATFNLENPEDQKYSIWRLLQNHSPEEILNSAEDDYEEDDISEKALEFYERNLDYPNRRTILHKTCKVIREFLDEDDEYEYSPKYQNISCVETEEDPFTISPPHAEQYCYIFHHPHEYRSCTTQTRRVRLFRKYQGSWKPYTQTIGVGCGCTLGITYAG